MGPLISERQRERVLSYIELGQTEGAKLAFGGVAPKGYSGVTTSTRRCSSVPTTR